MQTLYQSLLLCMVLVKLSLIPPFLLPSRKHSDMPMHRHLGNYLNEDQKTAWMAGIGKDAPEPHLSAAPSVNSYPIGQTGNGRGLLV